MRKPPAIELLVHEFVAMYRETGQHPSSVSTRTFAKRFGHCRQKSAKPIDEARALAAKQISEVNPPFVSLPEGFHVKRVSTLQRADGSIAAQWKIGEPDQTKITVAMMIEEAQAAASEIAPLVKNEFVPRNVGKSNTIDVVPIGDPHIGMLAWGEEAGEDFDLKIAEDLYEKAFARIFQGALSEEILLINLGDYFHTDNDKNQTNTSHYPLDVDSRMRKIVRTGIKILANALDASRVVGTNDEQGLVRRTLPPQIDSRISRVPS